MASVVWSPTADFSSFRYTFDQNTLLKTSQTIRKCAQECSSEQMGFNGIKSGDVSIKAIM